MSGWSGLAGVWPAVLVSGGVVRDRAVLRGAISSAPNSSTSSAACSRSVRWPCSAACGSRATCGCSRRSEAVSASARAGRPFQRRRRGGLPRRRGRRAGDCASCAHARLDALGIPERHRHSLGPAVDEGAAERRTGRAVGLPRREAGCRQHDAVADLGRAAAASARVPRFPGRGDTLSIARKAGDASYRNTRAEAARYNLNWLSATGTGILIAAIADRASICACRSARFWRSPR